MYHLYVLQSTIGLRAIWYNYAWWHLDIYEAIDYCLVVIQQIATENKCSFISLSHPPNIALELQKSFGSWDVSSEIGHFAPKKANLIDLETENI